MVSEKMRSLLAGSSAIRAMFEEGKRLKALHGQNKVFDFSLGNPAIPSPPQVGLAIEDILREEAPLELHGYMNNSGYESVRGEIAASLNARFHTAFSAENIIMTAGAAGGLNVILKSILEEGDEVCVFAPFFGEYKNYIENHGGKTVIVPPDTESFMPNLRELEKLISARTKAVIVNSPNNPTGVVYDENTIKALAALLSKKEAQYGAPICLISDEPYRELVYDGVQVPFLTRYYKNTVVCYSYSKSLSLPGERIGYLAIPSEVDGFEELAAAAGVATRVLGFVNAPSLFQKVAARCSGLTPDLRPYDYNRRVLYGSLLEMGFECVFPQGAFYLFLKSPVADERIFCEAAKKYGILLVVGRAFGCPGYVRIAYCVSKPTVDRSLQAFLKLSQEFKKELK